jgi:hypothetical protein
VIHKLHHQWTTILLGLFLAYCCVSARGEDVPVKGRFVGQSAITPESATDPVFRLENSGVGNLSHLGRVQTEWVVRSVWLDLANRQLILAQPDWIGTITAANGDQLFGRYVFRSTLLPILPSGEVDFEVDLIITGGTGRFTGAEGRGFASGRANGWTGVSTLELTGRISKIGLSGQ